MRACRLGSCMCSHNQSMTSSTLNASISSGAPRALPAAPFLPRAADGVGLTEHVSGFGLALADALRVAADQQPKALECSSIRTGTLSVRYR